MKLQDQGCIAAFAAASVVCLQPTSARLSAIVATDLSACFEDLTAVPHDLLEAWDSVGSCARDALDGGDGAIDILDAGYTKLFRGLVPGRWARPAYEAVYRAKRQEETVEYLGAIADLYRRGGIKLDVTERADFIAVEYDVMREMLVRAFEDVSGAADIAAELFEKHLSIWAPTQAAEVAAAAELPYFNAVARYLAALIAAVEI